MTNAGEAIDLVQKCLDDWPYAATRVPDIMARLEKVRELLKDQEPVEPYEDFTGHYVWRCGNCGATIFRINRDASDEDEKNFARFCKHCGRPVKWIENRAD